MPKFTVEHPTDKTPDQAFETVKSALSNGTEIKKFDSKAQLTFDEAKKNCSIKGGQFKAELNVTADGKGSKVAITVDLPLLLTPFKGKVQEGLQKMLKRYLA